MYLTFNGYFGDFRNDTQQTKALIKQNNKINLQCYHLRVFFVNNITHNRNVYCRDTSQVDKRGQNYSNCSEIIFNL